MRVSVMEGAGAIVSCVMFLQWLTTFPQLLAAGLDLKLKTYRCVCLCVHVCLCVYVCLFVSE